MNKTIKIIVIVLALVIGIAGGYYLYKRYLPEKVTKIEHVSGYNSIIITNKLDPDRLVINSGTSVTWTNEDINSHEIVFKNHDFGSGNMAPKDIWHYMFDKSGNYDYYLKDNPKIKGTVKVN